MTGTTCRDWGAVNQWSGGKRILVWPLTGKQWAKQPIVACLITRGDFSG